MVVVNERLGVRGSTALLLHEKEVGEEAISEAILLSNKWRRETFLLYS